MIAVPWKWLQGPILLGGSRLPLTSKICISLLWVPSSHFLVLYSLIFSFHLLVTGACFNFSQNCFMNNFRVIDNLPVATKFVLETGQVRTMIAKNFNVIPFYPNNTLFRTILKCLFFHLNIMYEKLLNLIIQYAWQLSDTIRIYIVPACLGLFMILYLFP